MSEQYERLATDGLHAWFLDLLPPPPGLVIDVGAGSGRDAAWFASRGFEVIAVEPSAGMRAEAARRHRSSPIQWRDDRLPALSGTLALGVAADVVHLGAVWMHLPHKDRPRAFRKLASLMRSGGIMLMTVRDGPPDEKRGFYAASVGEIESLARAQGLVVSRVERAPDRLGRANVSWNCLALRLPDDGTDALPLLRHVILNDSKVSTYKLALLRSLCRAADSAAGMARETDDDHVAVPLGLLATYWLRLYLPLLSAELPQGAVNRSGGKGLGFFNEAVARILAGAVPAINLRVGATFSEEEAKIVHSAIRAVAQTILKNPAKFTTYSGGGPVFPFAGGAPVPPSTHLTLDAAYLGSFGFLKVPADVWRAMQRFASWIEPAIVAEWIRLMKGYAAGMGRILDEASMAVAMMWTEPDRDVGLARARALDLLTRAPLRCVWSGRLLDAASFDMDHAFPWSAWPCGDLWNLVPAHRGVNQHKKRDRLPTDDLLLRRHDEIVSWWADAYEGAKHLAPQFVGEARSSLPALADEDVVAADEVFAAMRVQRLRLWRDQQIPEWNG